MSNCLLREASSVWIIASLWRFDTAIMSCAQCQTLEVLVYDTGLSVQQRTKIVIPCYEAILGLLEEETRSARSLVLSSIMWQSEILNFEGEYGITDTWIKPLSMIKRFSCLNKARWNIR